MTQMPQTTREPRRGRAGLNRVRIGAVIAIAVVVGFVAWLIFKDGDDDTTPAPQPPNSTAASVDQLRGLPGETGHDVYWVGRRPDNTYELTRTADGNVYIRYLPPGAAVGIPRPDFLTIGTYPRRNALGGLRRLARRTGSVSFEVERGGLAVYSRDSPSSVYVAYPGKDVQIEVYDPSGKRARNLARSQRLRPLR
jgi:hypothetical protein